MTHPTPREKYATLRCGLSSKFTIDFKSGIAVAVPLLLMAPHGKCQFATAHIILSILK